MTAIGPPTGRFKSRSRKLCAMHFALRGWLLFIDLAKIVSQNSFLDIRKSAQILNDVPACVVEEEIALVIAADGDEPLQLIAILEQIVNRLVSAFAGDNRDFRVGGLFGLGHGTCLLLSAKVYIRPSSCTTRGERVQLGYAKALLGKSFEREIDATHLGLF